MNRVLVASKIIIAASKTTLAASKIHPRFLSPPEVIPVASKAWVASKDLSPPRHLKEYVAITFPRIQSKSTPYKKNENECSSLSFNSFKEFQVVTFESIEDHLFQIVNANVMLLNFH